MLLNSIKDKKYKKRLLKAKENIDKRAIIEFKLSKTKRITSSSQIKFYNQIKKDFEKINGLDAKYKFLVGVDRHSKLSEKYIEKLKKLTRNRLNYFIYYIGCEKPKRVLLIRKGKISKIY